jgi:hypothetical protein
LIPTCIWQASAIVPKIGYPLYPNATSPVDLQQYYASQLVSERDFFGNVLRAKTSEVERSWKDVGRERDSDSWVMLADGEWETVWLFVLQSSFEGTGNKREGSKFRLAS